MNFKTHDVAGFVLSVLLFVFIGLPLFATPFDEKAKALVSAGDKSSFDKNLEAFGNSVSKGLDSAGKSLDEFSRKLREMTRDIQNPTSGTSGSSGGNTAKAPVEPDTTSSSGTGKPVEDAFSNFIRSSGSMCKAIGKWGSAAWNEITGPDADEAPITNAINGVKTDWAGADVKSSAKITAQATVDLGTAIGQFVKKLF
ncbi:MAG: hypothetical protein WA705_23545 [Candidatus Ozemobacteraceae bacterium]